jgi:cytidylate kinase
MTSVSAIAISGDPGSGKSTVGQILAEKLDLRFVSAGELHREMARKSNLTTLELNRAAETDRSIDDDVDQVLKDLAANDERVVVDSRMAWWFMSRAVALHLTVDPKKGASRAHARVDQPAEWYQSLDEARRHTRQRADSERLRFKNLYDVDTARLSNYDFVLDTSIASPEQVCEQVIGEMDGIRLPRDFPGRRPHVYVDPRSVYPTELTAAVRDLDPAEVDRLTRPDHLAEYPIEVGYAYPYYFAIDGHDRLSAAIRSGLPLLPARLLGEDDEVVYTGMTVHKYFDEMVLDQSLVSDWAAVHGIELDRPAG